MARFRFIADWLKVLLLRANCRLKGRRLVIISLIEHVGDIVACEPVARHVRRTQSDAFILWCLRAPYRELVENNPNVDGVMIVDCLTEWILLRKSRVLGEFIDLHPKERLCAVCGMTLKKTEGDPAIDVYNYYNHGNLLQAFTRSAGLTSFEISGPQLHVPVSAVKAVDSLHLPEKFAVFHARSSTVARDWDDGKWAVLLEKIRNRHGIFTIEIGLSAAAPSASSLYRSLCGQISLIELAEVIRRATVFIGVDSGPAHIANAVGTPGVILLGSYLSFRRYLPYSGGYADGSRAKLVYVDGPVKNITVESVYDAVTNFIQSGCTPDVQTAKAGSH